MNQLAAAGVQILWTLFYLLIFSLALSELVSRAKQLFRHYYEAKLSYHVSLMKREQEQAQAQDNTLHIV